MIQRGTNKMDAPRTRERIYPLLIVLMLLSVISILMKPMRAGAAGTVAAKYLNSVEEYLFLGKQGKQAFDFNINPRMKQGKATYLWYIVKDKGKPGSVKIDSRTGMVTAREAGTAYIACRITLPGGTIVRPVARVTVRNNITKVAISNLPADNEVEAGSYIDLNHTILDTVAGKKAVTQGIVRWELANDTAGAGTVTNNGKICPKEEGTFQIRAVCFQSTAKYKLWLTDKDKYKGYITAASKWATIQVNSAGITASSQQQLEQLLAKGKDKIILLTLAEAKFTIPKGNYLNTTLMVDTPNADVENHGVFKEIKVLAIKDHTWIEYADGNIIYLSDDVASIVIDENVSVKRIVIDKPNSAVNLEIKGSVEQVQVLAPSKLELGGDTRRVPVVVADTAKGSTIQASVPLSLTLNADTDIILEKGAENTVLDKSSHTVELSVINNTEKSVVVTTAKKEQETVPPRTSAISNQATAPSTQTGAYGIGVTAIGNIQGVPKAGIELKAGAVSPDGATVNYQWMISDIKGGVYHNIDGAVTDSYIPTDGDEGKYLRVKVTGKGSYYGDISSAPTDAVEASESKLQANAELKVKAYENAPVTSLGEVAVAEAMKEPAEAAVSAVGDNVVKADFESRIAIRAVLIQKTRLQLEAEAAVMAYETAPLTTASEITAAEGRKAAAEAAAAAVLEASERAALENRIVIQSAVIVQARLVLEAEAAVTIYEAAPLHNLTDVALAESMQTIADTAARQVTDTMIRTALLWRISDRALVIAETRAELEAESKVSAYEGAPLSTLTQVGVAEGLRAEADTAVAAVSNAGKKSGFLQRITSRSAVIAERRAELEAEEAVTAYEGAAISSLSEVALAEAMKPATESKVAAVGDPSVKAGLNQRIAERTALIAEARAELEAEEAVAAYEGAAISSLSEVALAEAMRPATESKVAAVSDLSVQAGLNQRIASRAAVIAAARQLLEAEEAVVLAEGSLTQTDKDTAQLLVTALPVNEQRTALQSRLDRIQAILDARTAVAVAETSQTQSAVDAATLLVDALPEGSTKTVLQSRIAAVQLIINNRIAQAANAVSIENVKGRIQGASFGMLQSDAASEANVKVRIEEIIAGLELEGVSAQVTKISYTPAVAGTETAVNGTDGAYIFTVALSKGTGATQAAAVTQSCTMNITASVYVPPEIITSIAVTNFNFATVNSSTASLVSKPMTSSDFSGSNAKSFTITDGAGNVINVNLNWNITSDQGFSIATLVGSAIESTLQDYFYAKGGTAALMNRTLWCASFAGDTFTLSTFYEGLQNSITITGADAGYFFSTLQARGTDLDTSANKSFSVTDGVHTANIVLNTDLTNMDGLVSKINTSLIQNSVQAVAVKLNESSFKIVGNDITVDGTDKSTFFSTFVSQ